LPNDSIRKILGLHDRDSAMHPTAAAQPAGSQKSGTAPAMSKKMEE